MTPLTLALDASTYAATVALLRGERLMGDRVVAMRGEGEERLMPAVAELIEEHAGDVAAVEAIVCGAGPGSFTSLRIAASIAKGLASALEVPLYAVSSLLLIVAGAERARCHRGSRWLATLDAMRGERFVQLIAVGSDGELREDGEPLILPAEELPAFAALHRADRIGPGEALDAVPRASGVVHLLPAVRAAGPVSLESWEPRYGRLAEAQVRWEAVHGRPLTGR